jgi:hypothetical protein
VTTLAVTTAGAVPLVGAFGSRKMENIFRAETKTAKGGDALPRNRTIAYILIVTHGRAPPRREACRRR